jgi:hypothetical protein
MRRIGMVALARTRLMALWRLLETGVWPAVAVLKGARPVEAEREVFWPAALVRAARGGARVCRANR